MGKMNKGTKERYDSFCMAFHTNGNNGTKAAISAGYSKKTAAAKATKLLRIGYIQDKLKELQKETAKTHGYTVEQRITWLKQIFDAGLGEYFDANGNARRENLAASVSAVKEMNAMLGTGSEDEETEPLHISFTVNSPVSDIRVTKGAA